LGPPLDAILPHKDLRAAPPDSGIDNIDPAHQENPLTGARRLRDTGYVEEHVTQGAGAIPGGLKDPQSGGGWHAIEERFLATGDAAPVQKALTLARDEMAVEAYRAVVEPVFPQSVAMLAAGTFGSGRTFPYSETEIVLLLESEKQADALKELLPEFVRLLWNAGLRLDSAVLTVAECLEAVERASVPAFSLLDRRLLAGDGGVYEKLEARLPAALGLHGQKLSLRLYELARARHARYGDTPHHAEPDVKEGPGGMRDLRLLGWLATLQPDREAPSGGLDDAAALVSSARCWLHYRARCDHNTLDFETQEMLASQAFARGRNSSAWMRAYFEGARRIFNQARRSIEDSERSQGSLLGSFREHRSRLSNDEFTVSHERLFLREPKRLSGDPALVLRMMEFIARHAVAPAADTERRLEASREAVAAWCAQGQPPWAALKPVLESPHSAMALRTIETAGLMPALFAEWSAIEHLAAPPAEYRYTLDEQTLRTIEALNELGSQAGAQRSRFAGLLSEIDDPALVVFALLFHETGRGGQDPAALGAERAASAMARIRMPEDARGVVEFLIRHQSDLSGAVGGRDMDDPATARLLAGRVGTIERLKALVVMTYARIVALGAGDKLAWRLEQLWRAYGVAQRELIRELETDRIQQVPENLPGNAEFIKGFPLRYLRAHSPAAIEAHLRLFELSRPTGVAVRLEPMEGAYRLTVVARDMPFLFASFAGAISSFGLDILKAEAFSNAAGVVLDTFVFGDPNGMLRQNPGEADRLSDLIQRVALGKTDAQRLMRGRGLADPGKRATPPQVQFDSEACPTATLVEIETADRPGLLFSLATVFSSNACNIDVVLVDTKGHRAIDVFYVAQEGAKLSPEAQARLKEKLLAAC
jgi:[protein-PII] uridylyltransferase